jgi:hypothetical protein
MSPDERRFNLTQGEVPALFGKHPEGLSVADLRARKRGEVEDPDLGPGRLAWEAHHADWSARGVAEREGWITQSCVRFVPHAAVSGLASQIYRIIPRLARQDGPGVLEVGLLPLLPPTTPDWMHIRINAVLACTGWRWGAFAALCGNSHRAYVVNRQVATIWQIETLADEFWRTITEEVVHAEDEDNALREANRS